MSVALGAPLGCGAATSDTNREDTATDASEPDATDDIAADASDPALSPYPSASSPSESAPIPPASLAPATTLPAVLPSTGSAAAASTVQLPEGCEAASQATLTDCDAGDNDTWVVDCDGDGIAGYSYYICDPDSLSPAPEMPGFDCDDEDPERHIHTLPDADGDGHGAPSIVPEEYGCSGETLPEGYAPLSTRTDCAEDDPEVHPDAPDVWGDGFDADCSNGDAPACDVMQSEFDEVVRRIDENAACDGQPDLFIAERADCWKCCGNAGPVYLFVGNRGTADFEGRLSLVWTNEDTGETDVVELGTSLAAGAVAETMTFDFGHGQFELSLQATDAAGNSVEDCDLANDVQSFLHPHCPCAR